MTTIDRIMQLNESSSDKKRRYQEFFKKTLSKYGVESLAELSVEEKKRFFKDIEAGWTEDDDD